MTIERRFGRPRQRRGGRFRLARLPNYDNWPPAREDRAEDQHLPFLSIELGDELSGRIEAVISVGATVTNHGNTAAFHPMVELLAQGGFGGSGYRRLAWKSIGRLEARATRTVRLTWRHPIHQVHSPRDVLIDPPPELVLYGLVYDPVLDARPDPDHHADFFHFHQKVTRRPWSSFSHDFHEPPLEPGEIIVPDEGPWRRLRRRQGVI